MIQVSKKIIASTAAALTLGAAGATGYALATNGGSSNVNAHLSDASVSVSPSDSPSPTVAVTPAPADVSSPVPAVTASPKPQVVASPTPSTPASSAAATPILPPAAPQPQYISAGNCVWHDTSQTTGYASTVAPCDSQTMQSPENKHWVVVFRGPGNWSPPTS